ncbi:uncharacterized protein B0I36DRAFT_101828 [Microdochium trichocladiopsis]|uniref:Uncharacterized protein n=1 Tax=Microdochium trichocladiopsis TaxID=1682393 RepID=A0A9P8Y849_9PEZI|nr:uncharacterized protein B0I36DRAFT_101828 [Microdochium trichocladiopsis]KAH7032882.1 hypothetical protein B0I36DRAFT_101828 [Microdochium trichocladiopsis]
MVTTTTTRRWLLQWAPRPPKPHSIVYRSSPTPFSPEPGGGDASIGSAARRRATPLGSDSHHHHNQPPPRESSVAAAARPVLLGAAGQLFPFSIVLSAPASGRLD